MVPISKAVTKESVSAYKQGSYKRILYRGFCLMSSVKFSPCKTDRRHAGQTNMTDYTDSFVTNVNQFFLTCSTVILYSNFWGQRERGGGGILQSIHIHRIFINLVFFSFLFLFFSYWHWFLDKNKIGEDSPHMHLICNESSSVQRYSVPKYCYHNYRTQLRKSLENLHIFESATTCIVTNYFEHTVKIWNWHPRFVLVIAFINIAYWKRTHASKITFILGVNACQEQTIQHWV